MYYQMLTGKDDLEKQWKPNQSPVCPICKKQYFDDFKKAQHRIERWIHEQWRRQHGSASDGVIRFWGRPHVLAKK